MGADLVTLLVALQLQVSDDGLTLLQGGRQMSGRDAGLTPRGKLLTIQLVDAVQRKTEAGGYLAL